MTINYIEKPQYSFLGSPFMKKSASRGTYLAMGVGLAVIVATPVVYVPLSNDVFSISIEVQGDDVVDTINYMSGAESDTLIEKYLSHVNASSLDEFRELWLTGEIEDSYEANYLASIL